MSSGMSGSKKGVTRRDFLAKAMTTAALGACVGSNIGGCTTCRPYKDAGSFEGNEPLFVETGVTNSYLIRCAGGFLLIDTSYPGEYDAFTAGLNSLGIDISDIRYLLLTHHHDDHAGFASRLIKDTGAVLIVHEMALPYLEKGINEDISRPVNTCVNCLVSAYGLIHDFTYPPVVVSGKDHVISGDDTAYLRGIGIDGDIIVTPGHTHDSISILLDNHSAIVGDAAMNFMNLCLPGYRPILVTDIDEVYESWEKLMNRGARRIYPAHGRVFNAQKLAARIKEKHNG